MDIYLCRTTDFKCPVSPRVHADIETLIAGGYSEDEIREAFIATYGERAVDVFYLTTAEGKKLDAEAIAELRRALLDAAIASNRAAAG